MGGSTDEGVTARWLRAACEWIVPAENPAASVYGVIVIGALMAAEGPARESWLDTLASAAIATALYWLAHAYAGVLGTRLKTGQRLTAGTLLAALAHDWPLLRGAAIPLLALVLSAALGAGRATAVSAAVWASAASIVAFEGIAAVRSHSQGGELLLEVGAGVAMGVAILALKVVLH